MAAEARARATWWLANDPSEECQAEVRALLAGAEAGGAGEAALVAAFTGELEFGTAGLRGPMGAGPVRMNELTVLQAAQGLVRAVLDAFGAEAREQGIVVGFDHRARGSLSSARFAALTARAALAEGVKVYLFSRFVATPLVPFAIRRLGAVAGVMVTASHNPAADNGYKVYWRNGAQIISPVDKAIATAIRENAAPWGGRAAYTGEAVSEAALRASPLVVDLTDELVAAYLEAIPAELCRMRGENEAAAGSPAGAARPGITYTAMHGVGRPYAAAMFAAFGLPAFTPTAAQVEPDPAFPTVAFPNPEEGKGALALAMATADAANDSIILANDPDADRLAVAEWVPAGSDGSYAPRVAGAAGEWRVFTGNEIGALLAAWQLRWFKARSKPEDVSRGIMIASTVSSKLLQSMAAVEGFAFQETLTGFKWMGNAMQTAEEAGRAVLFAYEEAIGFACSAAVRDKDGVSAAAVLGEMALALAREGSTLSGALHAIFDKYGHFATNNGYVFVDDPAKTLRIFARLRAEGHYWAKLGPLHIRHIRDLTTRGWDSEQAGGKPALPTSGGTQMLTYKLSNGAVATLRTSGTEPKLKWYVEAKAASREEAVAAAAETVRLLLDEAIQPEVHGLKRPAGH